jgi:uncharacterized protein YgiM (DUF1202 family)
MLAASRLLLVVILTLAFACVVNAQGRTAVIVSSSANLREAPSQSGEVKQEVAMGSAITVLDQKGAWYVVRIADSVGWMHGNAFRFTGGASALKIKSSVEGASERSAQPSRSVRPDSLPSGASSSTSGRSYIRGPRGGCYYYSGSGRKVYVDRSLCN